ncbi:MAG: ABC transporter permease subunit [Kofleriaceae bacterium]|nr:ABC transporter permease subunit [Myxococcales bacterium]MCB9562124.1 ABC transporter permease subunit [Kofleriaceae bacterium]
MARPRALALVAVVALALAGLSCGRRGHGGTWKAIQARGELVWGADVSGGEPYVFEDPADPSHYIGFEVDIMDAVARRLGVKARVAQYAWSNLVPSLERGDFDVVTNGLENTAERQDRILLSRPYYVYAELLAVRAGSPYRSLDDLRGRRVGTLNQTYAHDLLREAGVEVVLYEGDKEPYLDLAAGRIDAVLLDDIIANRSGCGVAGITCLPDDVARGTYVIGIRKADPALKAAIDAALDAMIADGELERILRTWKLWNPRQADLDVQVTQTPSVRARSFDGNQWRLFLDAAVVTLLLSIAAFALAVPVGLLLATMRVYGGPVSRGAARVYIELFRGTPVLLQLYVLYYGLAPYYSLGPVQAAILGLGLNYGAYEAEVYRGALLAIPRGQTEAAKALGLGPWLSLRHVLLPQALRLALPPMTNDFVSLLKDSSLVSSITVIELTKRMTIAAVDLRGWLVPGLACAGFYLVLSLPLSELARRLERRLAHDRRPHAL